MSDITKQVRKEIHDTLDKGLIVDQDEIAAAIIGARPDIHGGDAEFYRLFAFEHARDVARSCIKKAKASDLDPELQLTLPGFDHLQKAYFVRRGRRNLLVPVDQCTDIELLARAKEYDEMAKGCRAHAREIREYVAARAGQAA